MKIEDALLALNSPTNIRFGKLLGICEAFFGTCSVRGSHHRFKTPWPGDPRINLQKSDGKAKPYQVKQVVKALEKLAELEQSEDAPSGAEEEEA